MRVGSTNLRSLRDFAVAVIAWTLLMFLAGQWLRSWYERVTEHEPELASVTTIQVVDRTTEPLAEMASDVRSHDPMAALEAVWLAGLFGIGWASYRLWQRARQIAEAESRLRLQRDLADEVNASMDLEQVLQKCLRTCLDVAQFDCGSLHLIGADGAMELAAQLGLPPSALSVVNRYDPGSLRWQLTMQGDPIYTCHEQAASELPVPTGNPVLKGTAILPVRHQDRVVACLTISSWTRQEVPLASRLTLESIATTIGSAIARVRAEHEARRRQADYEALFDSSPDLEFVVDKGGVILHSNRTAATVLGISADDLQGMHIDDLREETLDPRPLPMFRGSSSDAIPDRTVFLLMADGSRLPVEIRVTEGSWFGSTVTVHVARDIREQRRHERLLSTERDLAVALAAAVSEEEIVNLCLEAVVHVTGLESTGIWLVQAPDRAQLVACRGRFHSMIGEIVSDDTDAERFNSLRAEHHARRGSDESRWPWGNDVDTRLQSVMTFPVDSADKWLATLFVATDSVAPLPDWICRALRAVVVHLRLALIRRETTERLRKLNRAIEQSSSTIVITDARGVIEYVNPRFEETTGYTAAEALGQFPSLLSSGEQPREFYKDLWQSISTRRDWRGEFHNRRKDGSLYWESATIAPICDEQGRITHFVAVKDDITERKLADDALRRSKETLAQHVQALKAANQALQEMNRIAESATRSKSEFLASMSHEIRTPMTAILGFAEVLAGTAVTPEQDDAIQTIQRNGEHLLALINEILDLSKIEAGKLSIEKIPVDPVALVEEVVGLMRLRAELKHLPLELEFGGPIPVTVLTDPTRLRQILVNLLGNAIKFTDVGRVRVRVEMSSSAGASPTIEFQVADSGLGMTEQQMVGLFQPFHQADASTTRQYGGTGLGLAISRRLAEMLGGGLVASSSPDSGSTFTLTIATGPLDNVTMRQCESNGVAKISSPRSDASDVPTSLGCRVLLAEDGPDNQRLICHLLKKAGAAVEVVENGRDAMERVLTTRRGAMGDVIDEESSEFDIIVMDMQMPVVDGYAATRELRAKGYSRPIIALTAHAMKDDEQKCLEAGCDAYLSKPVNRQTLISVVAQLVRERTTRAPSTVTALGGLS
jgi:PAS domain S-box-containing protein